MDSCWILASLWWIWWTFTHTHTLTLVNQHPLQSPVPHRHVPQRHSWQISAWRYRKHSSIRKPAYVRGEAVFLLLRVLVSVTVLTFLTTPLQISPPRGSLFTSRTTTRDEQAISYSASSLHFSPWECICGILIAVSASWMEILTHTQYSGYLPIPSVCSGNSVREVWVSFVQNANLEEW